MSKQRRAELESSNPSQIFSLADQIDGIFRGEIMVAETSTKLAIDPMFREFANTAGLKHLHRSSILSNILWAMATDDRDMAVRLRNEELKAMIFAKFQTAVIDFVKGHPELVPEMTRAWVHSILAKKKQEAEEEYFKYEEKIAKLSAADKAIDSIAAKEVEDQTMASTATATSPTAPRERGSGQIKCPSQGCGLEGDIGVYKKGLDPHGVERYVESVRHYDPRKGKITNHVTRRIDQQEFERLRKVYGTAPYGKRHKRVAVQIPEQANPNAVSQEFVNEQQRKVTCSAKDCGLTGEMAVYKEGDRNGGVVYYQSVRHFDPQKDRITHHHIRKISLNDFVFLRQKYGLAPKGISATRVKENQAGLYAVDALAEVAPSESADEQGVEQSPVQETQTQITEHDNNINNDNDKGNTTEAVNA